MRLYGLIHAVWLVALSLVLMGALFAGCSDDDDDSDDTSDSEPEISDADDDTDEAADPIEEGRAWLQAGEWDRAQAAFARALADDPDNPDARYGALMSAGQHLVSTFAVIYNFIASIDGFVQPDAKSANPNEEVLQYILNLALGELLGGSTDEVFENAEWVEDHGDRAFYVDDVPVVMGYDLIARIGPEFDGGERLGYQAFAGLFAGLAHLLGPLNVDINLAALSAPPDEGLQGLVESLCSLLTDPAFPDALTIDPDGFDEFAGTQFDFGRAFLSAGRSFAEVRGENDDQYDDVMAYRDRNGNRRYDEGEPFIVPGFGRLDADGMEALAGFETLFLDAGAAFLDGTDEDVNPEAADALSLGDFNVILNLLGLPSLLPAGITLDVASLYQGLNEDSLRDLVVELTLTLASLLPDPPECVEGL